jgi:glycosyltransferase involved in cell wall biosynthesis
VHVLPRVRTGVYCHDVDAFRCILDPATEPRSPWFRALARAILSGLRGASVVFHSTLDVGLTLEGHGIVPRERLVHAPYGVAPEFDADPDAVDGSESVLARIAGRPFLLHVGSELRRKRLDVLFDVFAAVRRHHPDLQLVQQGARLSPEHLARLRRLGIEDAVLQPPRLERRTLAGLYRRAAAVLVTSESEGFGFPVIEALACGAPVVASDIPVLREVGSEAVTFAPVGDVPDWSAKVRRVLSGGDPASLSDRLARAKRFTWEEHAKTILDAYQRIEARG